MSHISQAILFLLVATLSSAVFAEGRVFSLGDGQFGHIECGDGESLLGVVGDNEVQIDRITSTLDGCTEGRFRIEAGKKYVAVISSTAGIKNESIYWNKEVSGIYYENKNVIIFIVGLFTASLAKLVLILTEPVVQYIKITLKIGRTRKILIDISDKFHTEYEISEELRKITKGGYSDNYLIGTRMRRKITNLVEAFDAWANNDIGPETFRERLEQS